MPSYTASFEPPTTLIEGPLLFKLLRDPIVVEHGSRHITPDLTMEEMVRTAYTILERGTDTDEKKTAIVKFLIKLFDPARDANVHRFLFIISHDRLVALFKTTSVVSELTGRAQPGGLSFIANAMLYYNIQAHEGLKVQGLRGPAREATEAKLAEIYEWKRSLPGNIDIPRDTIPDQIAYGAYFFHITSRMQIRTYRDYAAFALRHKKQLAVGGVAAGLVGFFGAGVLPYLSDMDLSIDAMTVQMILVQLWFKDGFREVFQRSQRKVSLAYNELVRDATGGSEELYSQHSI